MYIIQETKRGDFQIRMMASNYECGRYCTLAEAEAALAGQHYIINRRAPDTFRPAQSRYYLLAAGTLFGQPAQMELGSVGEGAVSASRLNQLVRTAPRECGIEALSIVERHRNGRQWQTVAEQPLPTDLPAVAYVSGVITFYSSAPGGGEWIDYGRIASLWRNGERIASFTRMFRYDGRDDAAIQAQLAQWAAEYPGLILDAHIDWRRKMEVSGTASRLAFGTHGASFDWRPIERLCIENAIPIDIFRRGPEANVAALIIHWYAAHLAAGGAPDPVAEEYLAEVGAEARTGLILEISHHTNQ